MTGKQSQDTSADVQPHQRGGLEADLDHLDRNICSLASILRPLPSARRVPWTDSSEFRLGRLWHSDEWRRWLLGRSSIIPLTATLRCRSGLSLMEIGQFPTRSRGKVLGGEIHDGTPAPPPFPPSYSGCLVSEVRCPASSVSLLHGVGRWPTPQMRRGPSCG